MSVNILLAAASAIALVLPVIPAALITLLGSLSIQKSIYSRGVIISSKNLRLALVSAEKPSWWLMVTVVRSLLRPFLVVMSITPLAARAPEIEVEAASLSTVILSISLGLKSLITLLLTATPSIIYRGV